MYTNGRNAPCNSQGIQAFRSAMVAVLLAIVIPTIFCVIGQQLDRAARTSGQATFASAISAEAGVSMHNPAPSVAMKKSETADASQAFEPTQVEQEFSRIGGSNPQLPEEESEDLGQFPAISKAQGLNDLGETSKPAVVSAGPTMVLPPLAAEPEIMENAAGLPKDIANENVIPVEIASPLIVLGPSTSIPEPVATLDFSESLGPASSSVSLHQRQPSDCQNHRVRTDDPSEFREPTPPAASKPAHLVSLAPPASSDEVLEPADFLRDEKTSPLVNARVPVQTVATGHLRDNHEVITVSLEVSDRIAVGQIPDQVGQSLVVAGRPSDVLLRWHQAFPVKVLSKSRFQGESFDHLLTRGEGDAERVQVRLRDDGAGQWTLSLRREHQFPVISKVSKGHTVIWRITRSGVFVMVGI